MKVVFKYPLDVTDYQTVMLPECAKILTVQAQRDRPYLWALVDGQERPKEAIKILVAGTGHHVAIGPHDEYIGTFLLYDGGFVGHVFKVQPL